MPGQTINNQEDLVSVIMPSYNVERFISKSINSVLHQTYSNLELIIVDDCSTDGTLEIIHSFNDERIRLFINDTNQGAALTRNRALREAKGKYIAFLDADDIWDWVKLEKQIQFMKDNNYAFTYTDYIICHNDKWEKYKRTGPNKVDYRKLINYCYFSTITVIYDRYVVGLIQISDIKKNNDYAMWLHALKKADAYRYPYAYSYYIKHDGSVSGGKKLLLIKYHYRLFRNELHASNIKLFLLTINNLWYGFWKKIIYKEKIRDNIY